MITKYILPQTEYANIAPAPQCMQFRFFFPRHYLCNGKVSRQNRSVQIRTFYNKQRGTSASMYRENIKFVGTFYNEERKNIKKVKNTSMSKCCDRRRVHHKRTRFRQWIKCDPSTLLPPLGRPLETAARKKVFPPPPPAGPPSLIVRRRPTRKEFRRIVWLLLNKILQF